MSARKKPLSRREFLARAEMDPYEMKNLASDPKYADRIKKMKARMTQLPEETK